MTTFLFVTKPSRSPEKVKSEEIDWWSCASATKKGDRAFVYVASVGICFEWRILSDAKRNKKWKYICEVECVRSLNPPIKIEHLRESISKDEWSPPHQNFRGNKALLIPGEIASRIRSFQLKLASSKFDLYSLAQELNLKAQSHPIGKLQQIRAAIRGLKRQAGGNLFSPQTINEAFAFHHGGRSELQFNIGIDGSDSTMLRYGVAFSLETSRSLPTIDGLIPKIKRFNDFLRTHPNLYADMQMWHWQNSVRSHNYAPKAIPSTLTSEGVFVFLGSLAPISNLNHEAILAVLDRLLPLYEYVECEERTQSLPATRAKEIVFRPGYTERIASTTAKHPQQELTVILRQNVLQKALCERLVAKFGQEKVKAEWRLSMGGSVDVAVLQPDGYWFFEIKTEESPRACIRAAIGQLLEYSFWPGSQEASRLIVVGESAPDESSEEYCRRLNERFSLPISYEQFVL